MQRPGLSLAPGQKVVAMMGGMVREFDGGYAESTVVQASIVMPISTELPWEIVGALPEMLQTAYGSLTTGLDLQSGQTLLIRGGTTSIGMMAAALALDTLSSNGVAHPMLGPGTIAEQVRKIILKGVDAALELVERRLCQTHFTRRVFTGQSVPPASFRTNGSFVTSIRSGISLVVCGSLHMKERLMTCRKRYCIAAGEFLMPPFRAYRFDEFQRAHADREKNRGIGKIVVRTP
jgi:NADPH:quinone reductase-like Zn-dependent oxidoreductase